MRVSYIALSSYARELNSEGKFVCLNCNEIITAKKRRKYCSDKCLNEFMIRNNHALLRKKLIFEKRNTCNSCNEKFSPSKLILDHIMPIALGGREFDEGNLQVLCKFCNKIKTSQDLILIAQSRNKPS